jgi:hypothetical protein
MLCAWQRSSKYELHSFLFVPTGARTHHLSHSRRTLPITLPMNPRSIALEANTTNYTTDEPTIYRTRGEHYSLHYRWTHDLPHSRRTLPITPPMNPRSTALEANTTHYTTDEPTIYRTRDEHYPLHHRWTPDLSHSRRTLPITPPMNPRSITLEANTTHYTTDEPTVYHC